MSYRLIPLLQVARIIVGFLFILSGYAGLTQGLAPVSYIQPHEYGIIMIVLGSMLGVGLFTRPVFLLGFLAWATASVVQAISASPTRRSATITETSAT